VQVGDIGQLKIIRTEGVRAWNEWRRANPDIKPNLSMAYLIGYELPGIDLSNADLSWADALNANFSGANLKGANLTGIDARD
jgi:uncharacterized protein YjbI with pentapeptide repeats